MKQQSSQWIPIIHHSVQLADIVILPDNIQKIPESIDGKLAEVEKLIALLPNDIYRIKKRLASDADLVLELFWGIFGQPHEKSVFNLDPISDHQSLKEEIKKTLLECKVEIPTSPTAIVVFPQYCVRDQNHGFYWLANTFALFINQNDPEWKNKLGKVLAHEYFHAAKQCYEPASHRYHSTLGGKLVDEGFAQLFSEYINRHEPGDIYNSLKLFSPDEVMYYLKKWKRNYSSTSEKSDEYFRGKGTAPMGVGYAVGHYLALAYSGNQKTLDWTAITEIPLDKLFKESLACFLEKMSASDHHGSSER